MDVASVVFFRAVNVGNHQRFQPAQLARDLHAWDVANIGAAGTLVVPRRIEEAQLRAEILRRLSFTPEFFICPAADILALGDHDPFTACSRRSDVKPFLSILSEVPRDHFPVPLEVPKGKDWEVRVIERIGRFAFSVRRVQKHGRWYPNEVVEKHFGSSATTRGWGIVDQIARALVQNRGSETS